MFHLAAVIIGYDKKLLPSFVRCGLCGEEIPPREPWLTSTDENLTWIDENFAWIVNQFEMHRERRHFPAPESK
jgi:hypothetical protein